MRPSPFDTQAAVRSPDGRWTATIANARERCRPAFGELDEPGPTGGTLEISNGIKIEDCNPSMAWSDDSRYLAVPHWEEWILAQSERIVCRTRIYIIDVQAGRVAISDRPLGPVEIRWFLAGKVGLVELMGQAWEIDVGLLSWDSLLST